MVSASALIGVQHWHGHGLLTAVERSSAYSFHAGFHKVGYRTAGPTSAEGTSFVSSSINCLWYGTN